MRIHEYILGQCAEQLRRHALPVVAMDQIAAKSRAARLQRIADEIEEMSDDEALVRLRSIRDSHQANLKDTISLVFSLSEITWFQCVVDGCAQEATGWIEVSRSGFDGSRFTNLPQYRRMLGVNNCASSIRKLETEGDAAWLQRRAQWLSAYHPDVKVIHSQKRWVSGGSYEEISLGTVKSFSEVEHTVEADLISVRGIRLSGDVEYEIVDVFPKHDTRGAIGRARQISGKPSRGPLIEFRDYRLELVA